MKQTLEVVLLLRS